MQVTQNIWRYYKKLCPAINKSCEYALISQRWMYDDEKI